VVDIKMAGMEKELLEEVKRGYMVGYGVHPLATS